MKKRRNSEVRYHIIFWVIYLFLWGARDMVFYPHLLSNVVMNLIFTLPVAPFVYLNINFLVPKYLFKKRWGLYTFLFCLGLFISTWLRYHTYQFMFVDVLGAMDAIEQFSGWNGIIILGSENMILFMITMALFVVKEWYIKERYARELEQKNMESELNMLKAQLQPHFLFNNLNTIYFLMESNPKLAKEVMIQFSEVLSHQLYNAKKDKVSLKEELESLENYLKIQKIRHEDFLKLNYSFPTETDGLQIAPMILLTFVENAFKHSQKEEGYSIDIQLDLKGKNLHLHVGNTSGHIAEKENGGIGLENVRRRLELIYPGKHDLKMEESEESYVVDLTLNLESNG